MELVNRHRSHENSGLFGLRRIGKTSVIFGIMRTLEQVGSKGVFIDCGNPTLHKNTWNHALYYILNEIRTSHGMNRIGLEMEEFTEQRAPSLFEKELRKISGRFNGQSFLLIFDEIEHISFGISPSTHWAHGKDFVFLWQTLRSIFQKYDDLFTFLIVGTNPTCVETPTILGVDNPIFSQVPLQYLPNFDVHQTRSMVRQLSRIMAINFDETIFAKLTDDFGGHPYLVRQVCSTICRMCSDERPARVTKNLYKQAKQKFLREHSSYIELTLSVLNKFYNEEYEMLNLLANGDVKTFNEFASMSNEFTNHLIGYGILDYYDGNYDFKIEVIKSYLADKNKYKRLNLSEEEKWAEISARRNSLEPKLRMIVRNQLRASYGKSEAAEFILAIFGNPRKSRYSGFEYNDLFDASKVEIYLEDLRKIINKHWEVFKHIFGKDKETYNQRMKILNSSRADAHAKPIDEEMFQLFRLCTTKLEDQIADFLN